VLANLIADDNEEDSESVDPDWHEGISDEEVDIRDILAGTRRTHEGSDVEAEDYFAELPAYVLSSSAQTRARNRASALASPSSARGQPSSRSGGSGASSEGGLFRRHLNRILGLFQRHPNPGYSRAPFNAAAVSRMNLLAYGPGSASSSSSSSAGINPFALMHRELTRMAVVLLFNFSLSASQWG
jgi:hypothetical protein